MPKHEIISPAGSRLETDLKEYLLQYFEHKDLQRLELHGGRILISLTAPYSNRKGRDGNTIKVNNKFIEELDKIKNSKKDLTKELDLLTVKQLREICKLIKIPIRSSASAFEIRSEIINHFQAEKLWFGISGTRDKRKTK